MGRRPSFHDISVSSPFILAGPDFPTPGGDHSFPRLSLPVTFVYRQRLNSPKCWPTSRFACCPDIGLGVPRFTGALEGQKKGGFYQPFAGRDRGVRSSVPVYITFYSSRDVPETQSISP